MTGGRPRHGHSRNGGSREYRSWTAMRNRCNNPTAEHYAEYGGRGITICDRWGLFENFLSDMGPRPPDSSLERKDNARGYTPDNCEWADRAVQSRNRRWNHRVEIAGVTKTRSEWCREYGISERTVRNRVARNGMSLAAAITTPVGAPLNG